MLRWWRQWLILPCWYQVFSQVRIVGSRLSRNPACSWSSPSCSWPSSATRPCCSCGSSTCSRASCSPDWRDTGCGAIPADDVVLLKPKKTFTAKMEPQVQWENCSNFFIMLQDPSLWDWSQEKEAIYSSTSIMGIKCCHFVNKTRISWQHESNCRRHNRTIVQYVCNCWFSLIRYLHT